MTRSPSRRACAWRPPPDTEPTSRSSGPSITPVRRRCGRPSATGCTTAGTCAGWWTRSCPVSRRDLCHAVGLARLVLALGQQRPEHAPGAAGGEEPVGLAAEGAEELLLEALAPEIDGTRQVWMQVLDERLGHDAADPDGEGERERGRRDGDIEEPRVLPSESVGQVPPEIAHHRVHERGDGPLHHLVADMAQELGQVESRGRPAPGAPEKRDIVEHAQVPPRVLADHLLGGLGQIGELDHGHGLDEDAAPPQRIAERGVLGGARGGEAAERHERVQAHELVVAEADLRAAEEKFEGRPDQPGQARRSRSERREQAQALDLVDEPRDGHADEDRGLLDRADLAADRQTIVIAERQRDALIRQSARPGQLAMGDPAVGVRVGDRVGVADAHEDARGVGVFAQDLGDRLGPERPVELVGLAPGSGHDQEREPLLLIRREAVTEPAHQLTGAGPDGGMGGALLPLLRDHDHVEPAMGIARADEGRHGSGDVGLLVGRDEMQEHGGARLSLEALLTGQLVQARIRLSHEADGEEGLEREPRAPVFLHLVPAYQEPDIAATVSALVGSRYPHGRLHVVVITKEGEERAPHPAIGASTGELVRRLRDGLPPYQQKRLTLLVMPGPGRKAHQLNWALRPEAVAEILGEDADPTRVFVGVSDADSVPDPDAYRWIAHRELTGSGALAYQGITLSLGNYDRLTIRGKICAIQQSSIFIRVSIARLINEVKRLRLFAALAARAPRLARLVRPAFELLFRRSQICLGHNQFVRLDALVSLGGFPTSGATEDSTLGYALGGRGILIQAMPMVELTDLPETSEKVIRQNARWYLGVLDDIPFLWRAWRGSPSAFNLAQFLRHVGNKVVEWPIAALVYPVVGYLGWYLAYTFRWQHPWLFYIAIAAPTLSLALTIWVGGILTQSLIEDLHPYLPRRVDQRLGQDAA